MNPSYKLFTVLKTASSVLATKTCTSLIGQYHVASLRQTIKSISQLVTSKK